MGSVLASATCCVGEEVEPTPRTPKPRFTDSPRTSNVNTRSNAQRSELSGFGSRRASKSARATRLTAGHGYRRLGGVSPSSARMIRTQVAEDQDYDEPEDCHGKVTESVDLEEDPVKRAVTHMNHALDGYDKQELADALAEASCLKLENPDDKESLGRVKERLRMVRARGSFTSQRRQRETQEEQTKQNRIVQDRRRKEEAERRKRDDLEERWEKDDRKLATKDTQKPPKVKLLRGENAAAG